MTHLNDGISDYKNRRTCIINEINRLNSDIFDVHNRLLEAKHSKQLSLVEKNKSETIGQINNIGDFYHKVKIATSRPKLSANEYLSDAIKMEKVIDTINTLNENNMPKESLFIPDPLFYEEERLIKEKYGNLRERIISTVKDERILRQELKNVDVLERKDLSKISFKNNEINKVLDQVLSNITSKTSATIKDRRKYLLESIRDRYLTRVSLSPDDPIDKNNKNNKNKDYNSVHVLSLLRKPNQLDQLNKTHHDWDNIVKDLSDKLDNLIKERDMAKNQIKLLDSDFDPINILNMNITNVTNITNINNEDIKKEAKPISDIIGIGNIDMGMLSGENSIESADNLSLSELVNQTLMNIDFNSDNFNDIDRMLDEFNNM